MRKSLSDNGISPLAFSGDRRGDSFVLGATRRVETSHRGEQSPKATTRIAIFSLPRGSAL
ncbi:MAG: hypothetical protein DCC67_20255 [Planctomycetota bacterium]|nr:MAG: hypothetical protein DCC67_20255 [Planctomycetota bacterium]